MTDLDDVIAAINGLKRTVENRPKTAHTVAAGIGGVLLYMFISSLVGGMWNSRFIFSLRYNVPSEQVTIDEKPHDCDFLHAPLGDKGCSYVRDVTVIKTGTNAAGEHFVTYDEGKTWSPDPQQQAKSGVMVWWKKQ